VFSLVIYAIAYAVRLTPEEVQAHIEESRAEAAIEDAELA
jgi:hypothetical protein